MLETAKRCEGTSKSAIDLACVPEWPPIYPNVHAAAALIWSSGSFISAYFSGEIPFALIIPIAKVSSKAAIYPRVIIPGNLALPLVSPI